VARTVTTSVDAIMTGAVAIAELEAQLAPWTREVVSLKPRRREAFVLREHRLTFDEVSICLEVSPSCASQLDHDAVADLARIARRGALIELHGPPRVPPYPTSDARPRVPHELRPALDLPIADLALGKRAANALANAGIVRIGDLVVRSEADLLRLWNLGRKALREIRTALASFGLGVGMAVDLPPAEPQGHSSQNDHGEGATDDPECDRDPGS
jgi:DNA-directed RNA polymerase alpha subunit